MAIKEKDKKFTDVQEKEENKLIINPSKDFVPINNIDNEIKNKNSILTILIWVIITILIVFTLIFMVYNTLNTNILSGVSIKGFDVSGLSVSDAQYQLDNYLASKIPDEITVKHGDFETTISTSQINVKFDTKTATNSAYRIGRNGSFLENNFYALSAMFGTEINIEPILKIDKNQLSKNLEDISAQLPDTVTESSYYIEGSNLIITAGKDGNVVDVEASIEAIKTAISDFSANNGPVELVVKTQSPKDIDIDSIYNEVKTTNFLRYCLI